MPQCLALPRAALFEEPVLPLAAVASTVRRRESEELLPLVCGLFPRRAAAGALELVAGWAGWPTPVARLLSVFWLRRAAPAPGCGLGGGRTTGLRPLAFATAPSPGFATTDLRPTASAKTPATLAIEAGAGMGTVLLPADVREVALLLDPLPVERSDLTIHPHDGC